MYIRKIKIKQLLDKCYSTVSKDMPAYNSKCRPNQFCLKSGMVTESLTKSSQRILIGRLCLFTNTYQWLSLRKQVG